MYAAPVRKPIRLHGRMTDTLAPARASVSPGSEPESLFIWGDLPGEIYLGRSKSSTSFSSSSTLTVLRNCRSSSVAGSSSLPMHVTASV